MNPMFTTEEGATLEVTGWDDGTVWFELATCSCPSHWHNPSRVLVVADGTAACRCIRCGRVYRLRMEVEVEGPAVADAVTAY